MMSTNMRVYIRADNLAEIHQRIDGMVKSGWVQTTALAYTHINDKSGWEVAMEYPIKDLPDDLEVLPPFDAVSRGLDRILFAALLVSCLFVGVALAVALWAIAVRLWG